MVGSQGGAECTGHDQFFIQINTFLAIRFPLHPLFRPQRSTSPPFMGGCKSSLKAAFQNTIKTLSVSKDDSANVRDISFI